MSHDPSASFCECPACAALRETCRQDGHEWSRNHLGAPVVGDFALCIRCGKFERQLKVVAE